MTESPSDHFAESDFYEWTAGTVLAGRYRLERPLGQGAMGEVWRARHLTLDTMVALKLLSNLDAPEADELKVRFEREAKAAVRIDSPHAVRVSDYGVDGKTHFIAMELLEGEDLGARLSRVGALAPGRVSTMVLEMSRALGKAHALGIVHRDIKPHNVFLAAVDGHEITKILDFGMVKLTSQPVNPLLTQVGKLVGTPAYMSPEQTKTDVELDGRSDLWQVAVVAFEAMCGRRPFDAVALSELFGQICYLPIPRPSEVAAVPPAFDAWFARATQRDPDQRFQTAEEMAEALVRAVPPTPGVIDVPDISGVRRASDPVGAARDPHRVTGTTTGVVSAPSFGPAPERTRLGVVAGIAAAVAIVLTTAALVLLGGGADSDEADAVATAPPAEDSTPASEEAPSPRLPEAPSARPTASASAAPSATAPATSPRHGPPSLRGPTPPRRSGEGAPAPDSAKRPEDVLGI